MKLAAIADAILDETSTPAQLRGALREFSDLCSIESGIEPNKSFDAWAEDSFLDSGVAINAQAAAHCVTDYLRTVVFIRGVNAALNTALEQFPDVPIKVLYAGCGPYASLLLPLLHRFDPTRLDLTFLDYHQHSLDSVAHLVEFFGCQNYAICLQQADATQYRNSEPLHLVIAEVMQKALEQEPQFAVTANLAPQLHDDGVFIPGKIEVRLCFGNLACERETFRTQGEIDTESLILSGSRVMLDSVMAIESKQAAALEKTAVLDLRTGSKRLPPQLIDIPPLSEICGLDPLLLTRIQVYAHHRLGDYEAEITLPLLCTEIARAQAGAPVYVSYELGGYPKLQFSTELGSAASTCESGGGR